MKRIAMFTQGGVARPGTVGFMPSMYDFVARLSEMFDITVYGTSSGDNDEGTFLCGRARVVLTSAKFSDGIVKKMRVLGTSFFRDHWERPYHLIHGQWALPGGFIAVTLSKALKLPSVVTIHGADAAAVHEVGYGHFLRLRTRVPTRWTCKHSTVLTTLTTFQVEQLSGHGVKRRDILAIPFGVDSQMFTYSTRQYPPPLNLLHVANMTAVKNQEGVLRLFRILLEETDAYLRMIGPDYLKGKIQALSESLGLAGRTEFLGHIQHKDLPAHYRWAHLLLHTSYYEGQGLVVAEAAACGAIPCGSRVGLIADLDGICTVSEKPGNIEDLAKKILDLLNDKERMERLRKNGRTWTEEHDINWTVRRFAQLYDELLGPVGGKCV